MSTPLPGQIRCPTCHRSTPPAAFCTQCGSEIPASARARPRGLDREELQERIRTRRPGDLAFRRGSFPGEGPEAPASPYQPFRPEPEDELIIPTPDAPAADAPRVDNTAPGFDDRPPALAPPPPAAQTPPSTPPTSATEPPAPRPAPAAPVTPPPEPPSAPPPVATPPPVFTPPTVRPAAPPAPPLVAAPKPVVAPPPVVAQPVVPPPVVPPPPAEEVGVAAPGWAGSADAEAAADANDYRYRRFDDDWDDGRSGLSPLAIGGFVLLGVLAIAVGAFIAGIFSGGVAVASPTPTPLVTAEPTATAAPSVAATPSASLPASPASFGSSPIPFPDGFTARAEPCAEEPSSQDGCNSSGSSVTGGTVWVWVGFRKGNDADVLKVSIVDASGSSVGDGSLELGSIGCGNSCAGWGRFKFGGLTVGNYTINVSRNDAPAAQASFTVTS